MNNLSKIILVEMLKQGKKQEKDKVAVKPFKKQPETVSMEAPTALEEATPSLDKKKTRRNS